jgi:hypothetical protein
MKIRCMCELDERSPTSQFSRDFGPYPALKTTVI